MAIASSSSSFQESKSEPFAPKFLEEGGNIAREIVPSAQQSAENQQARLNEYINHLKQLRSLAVRAARSAGAKGGGMQNPIAVSRALDELSMQAGLPIDAEISRAIQGSNNIENTLNSMMAQAASLMTALGSVQRSESRGSSQSSGGGGGTVSSSSRRGGRGGFGGDMGEYVDIRGNRSRVRPASSGAEFVQGSSLPQGFDAWGQESSGRGGGFDSGPSMSPGGDMGGNMLQDWTGIQKALSNLPGASSFGFAWNQPMEGGDPFDWNFGMGSQNPGDMGMPSFDVSDASWTSPSFDTSQFNDSFSRFESSFDNPFPTANAYSGGMPWFDDSGFASNDFYSDIGSDAPLYNF